MSIGARVRQPDEARLEYLRALGIEQWVPRMPRVPRPVPVVPGDEWHALRQTVSICMKCELAKTRTQTVFGVGSDDAEWMVIGEAPGAEEDKRGEPFVGRGGQLLDAMLHSIGIQRGRNAFIANMLKCRPPNNRDPRTEELACCRPYLLQQIRLIRPRVILAVGRIAAQNLLQSETPVGRLRGQVHVFGELSTPLVVTYHPAYLLRSPGEKRKAWDDLRLAREVFARTPANNASVSL
jgi:DNA polymerase